ncbi:MAG TPA: MarR family winged helix-turn-helix transcriptional regulator [Rhabdaerophilum sp.]|nr:MarR family winged helix-turn-helix transcriptional regulator [Rhabdaerophilum sp.]
MRNDKSSRQPVDPSSVSVAPLKLENFLPYRLNLLATEISQALAQAYGERFGISIPEWRVLATLGQFGTITARDICAHSHMHKTTVSRAVATLEKRKLLARKANRNDLREAFLDLSEEGRRVYLDIVPMATAFSEALCRGLGAEEKSQLDRLIDKLMSQLGQIAHQS